MTFTESSKKLVKGCKKQYDYHGDVCGDVCGKTLVDGSLDYCYPCLARISQKLESEKMFLDSFLHVNKNTLGHYNSTLQFVNESIDDLKESIRLLEGAKT